MFVGGEFTGAKGGLSALNSEKKLGLEGCTGGVVRCGPSCCFVESDGLRGGVEATGDSSEMEVAEAFLACAIGGRAAL